MCRQQTLDLRRVQNHQVKPARQVLHQARHQRVLRQLCRLRAPRDPRKQRDPVRRRGDRRLAQGLIRRQNFRPVARRVDTQLPRQIRVLSVDVDQRHATARRSGRAGQRQRHRRAPFLTRGAGHDHDAQPLLDRGGQRFSRLGQRRAAGFIQPHYRLRPAPAVHLPDGSQREGGLGLDAGRATRPRPSRSKIPPRAPNRRRRAIGSQYRPRGRRHSGRHGCSRVDVDVGHLHDGCALPRVGWAVDRGFPARIHTGLRPRTVADGRHPEHPRRPSCRGLRRLGLSTTVRPELVCRPRGDLSPRVASRHRSQPGRRRTIDVLQPVLCPHRRHRRGVQLGYVIALAMLYQRHRQMRHEVRGVGVGRTVDSQTLQTGGTTAQRSHGAAGHARRRWLPPRGRHVPSPRIARGRTVFGERLDENAVQSVHEASSRRNHGVHKLSQRRRRGGRRAVGAVQRRLTRR